MTTFIVIVQSGSLHAACRNTLFYTRRKEIKRQRRISLSRGSLLPGTRRNHSARPFFARADRARDDTRSDNPPLHSAPTSFLPPRRDTDGTRDETGVSPDTGGNEGIAGSERPKG